MARRSVRPKSRPREQSLAGPIRLSRFQLILRPHGAKPASGRVWCASPGTSDLRRIRSARVIEAAITGDIPAGFAERIAAHKAELIVKAPNVASRKASEMAL